MALAKVTNRPRDVEMQALLEPNSRQPASGHPYRGFTLINASKEVKDIKVRRTKVKVKFALRLSFYYVHIKVIKVSHLLADGQLN